MSYANHVQGAAFSRSLWSFTSKYRQFLILVLLVLIALGTIAASASYLQLQTKVRELSALEPIELMAVAKDLQVGDVINESNLVPMFLYAREYGLHKESYVLVSAKQQLIGRVVKVPLLARSFIRQEHLAEKGSLPGLVNLIDKNHSLIDIAVPQQGFNVFIRPEDKVDLYEVKDQRSELIAKQVKVILVDSEPLGKAPLKVTSDSRLQRHLSIAVPDAIFERAIKAKQAKTLMITYRHGSVTAITSEPKRHAIAKVSLKTNDPFQPLMLIRGNDKEVLNR